MTIIIVIMLRINQVRGIMHKSYGTGRRKTSSARVYLNEGTGVIKINAREVDDFIKSKSLKSLMLSPLEKSTNSEGRFKNHCFWWRSSRSSWCHTTRTHKSSCKISIRPFAYNEKRRFYDSRC